MPQLSIITINYNNSNGLEKTIQSVVSQIFTDYEFIVIDGGSTDDSIKVIKKYSNKITYWNSESDSGIYNAQNKGIKNAKGNYCLFLNSGDYLYKNDVLANIFKENPTAGLIYGDMIFDYGNGKLIKKQQPDAISFFYMMDTSIWHPATFIKRELFLEYGYYDEQFKIAADYDFFLNAIINKNTACKHLPIAVSVFDTTGVSSDINYLEKNKSERLQIQKKYFSDIIIQSAYEHIAFINSDSVKLLLWLKSKKWLYGITKTLFNFFISIKRIISK